MRSYPIPPPPPPRFIRDLVIPTEDRGGGPQRDIRVLPSVLALFLIIAVFLNTTAVFADDASSTPAVAPSADASSTPAAVTPPSDPAPSPAAPPDATTSTTAAASSTLPPVEASTTLNIAGPTLASSTPPAITDATSSAVSTSSIDVATSTDPANGVSSSTPSVVASTTDGAVASSTGTSTPPAPDASFAGTFSNITATTTASDTIASGAIGSDAPTSTAGASATASTTANTNNDQNNSPGAPTTPSPTTAPTAAPVNADQIRSKVRSELEQQLQSAYESQLNAALADEQKKLDAAEQADKETMRAELTAQIKQQLQAGCLAFDDGSYFCVNPQQASGTYAAPAAYANVYSAKDPQTGTQQIFVQNSGRVTQITHANYDNIQPVWNKERTFIAWQGLVNDRWQIFLYNMATGATNMISGGGANNINPTIEGDRVAWQGWDNNWEIYLAQPSSSSSAAGWQVAEVTHDAWANVEPQLAGGLLAWQSYQNGSWQIFVDNLASGNISRVSTGNGVNTDPHFLLTWNNQENGQSQTLQYDISSGAVSVLSAVPGPPPITPLPAAPADKNPATLPAGSATSSTTTSTSTKSPGDGNDPILN